MKTVIRDEDRCYNDEWLTQKEYMILVNIYTPNIGAPKCIEQILTHVKEEIDRNTIREGDFNTSLTSMDKSSWQKINKETSVLNST